MTLQERQRARADYLITVRDDEFDALLHREAADALDAAEAVCKEQEITLNATMEELRAAEAEIARLKKDNLEAITYARFAGDAKQILQQIQSLAEACKGYARLIKKPPPREEGGHSQAREISSNSEE